MIIMQAADKPAELALGAKPLQTKGGPDSDCIA
jgi:hypothetical protein